MTNTIRNCGRIVLEDTVRFVKDDAKRTKDDFKRAGTFVTKLIYPVTGQLSAELNERIENALGPKNYSARNAYIASVAVNIPLYLVGGFISVFVSCPESVNHPSMRTVFSIFGALVAPALFEGTLRHNLLHKEYGEGYRASLPGKAVSLAITPAVRAYDYCKSVRERAKEKGK